MADFVSDGFAVDVGSAVNVAGAGSTGAGVAGAGLTGAGVAGAGLTGAGVAGAGSTGAAGVDVVGVDVAGAGLTGVAGVVAEVDIVGVDVAGAGVGFVAEGLVVVGAADVAARVGTGLVGTVVGAFKGFLLDFEPPGRAGAVVVVPPLERPPGLDVIAGPAAPAAGPAVRGGRVCTASGASEWGSGVIVPDATEGVGSANGAWSGSGEVWCEVWPAAVAPSA